MPLYFSQNTNGDTTRIVVSPSAKEKRDSYKILQIAPYKRLEFRRISDKYQKLEFYISSGAGTVVQSRMGILTGLYHVVQVFHIASSQLSYSYMLDEINTIL